MDRLKEDIVPILNNMPIGVAVWEGVPGSYDPQDFRLVFANHTALETASSPLEHRVGLSMGEAFPGMQGSLTAKNIFKTLDSQPVPVFEDYVNGRWFRLGLHPVSDRVIVTYYNIDAEKGLALANMHLRDSNDQLEQFAYIASHDLQEPLRTITSFVDILRSDLEENLSAEDIENFEYISAAASRLRDLVAGLLDFSRINTRAQDLEPGSLTEVARKAAKDVVNGWNWVKIEGELGCVPMDQTQMHRVFINLISNSVKYAKPDVDPQILIKAVDNKDEIVISVRDNGLGIDPSYHDMVFQAFKRLHTQHDIKGTGIGLAIVKKIVERHGGTIWVESSSSDGTTINFTLPKGSSGPTEG